MSPTTLNEMSFLLPTSGSYSTKLSVCQEIPQSNKEKKETILIVNLYSTIKV